MELSGTRQVNKQTDRSKGQRGHSRDQMEKMSEYPSSKVIKILNILLVLQSLVLLVFLTFVDKASKVAVFPWYLRSQLVLILIALILTVGFTCILFDAGKIGQRISSQFIHFLDKRSSYFILSISLIIFPVLLIVYTLPRDLFDLRFLIYLDRLFPVFVYSVLVIYEISFTLLVLRNQNKFPTLAKSFLENIRHPIFIAIIALFIYIFVTGLGNTPDPVSWRPMGSPLLVWQITLSILVGAVYGCVEQIFIPTRIRKWTGIVLLVSIYIIAISAWLGQPLQVSYYAPEVRPPNFEVYPYSDALYYSISAESVLIGSGLNGWSAVPRPLLITLLSYVFAFASGVYGNVILIQTFFLALIPILFFFIGTELGGRYLGISLALLSIFREVVAIQSTPFIPVSNSKLILSDLPALLIFLMLVLVIIKWAKGSHSSGKFPVLIGGILGVLALIRTQFLVLYPFIIFIATIKYWKYPKYTWVKQAGIVTFTLFLTVAPWLIRNYVLTNTIIFDDHVGFVATRYLTGKPTEMSNSDLNSNSIMAILSAMIKSPSGVLGIIANHFIRSIISTILVISPALRVDDLHLLLSTSGYIPGARLTLTPVQFLGVVFILLTIAYGLRKLYKNHRLAPFTPLILFLGYDLSISAARDSGGRYILPIDWMGYVYFAIGIFFLIQKIINLIKPVDRMPIIAPAIGQQKEITVHRAGYSLLILFFAIGCFIPLTEWIHPKMYPARTAAEILTELKSDPALYNSASEILRDPNKTIISGRALYPRFYPSNKGEQGSAWVAYSPQDYARMGFEVINDRGSTDVIYATRDRDLYFLNRSGVILIGEYQYANVKDQSYPYFRPELIILTDTNPMIAYRNANQ